MSFFRVLVVALLAALGAAPTVAAGPLVVGAAEDAAKWGGLAAATTQMRLAQLAGLDAVRLTSGWQPGLRAPTENELGHLRDAAGGAQLSGMRVFVTVYNPRQKWTPRTARRRAEFAAYAAEIARAVPGVTDLIVGNEPNLNRFWMPQFDRRGRTTSAPGYLRLLAQTYDAVKDAAPDVVVVGGAVSARGADNPKSSRHTHSPTRFVRELGRAYRASRRSRPVMDAFALHPYPAPGRSPAKPYPARSTSIGIADYPKLVQLLGRAFDGTAQEGSSLPVIYTEFGVQSKIPKSKQRLYRNLKAPAARQAVSEKVQATHYRQALALAQCQPTVIGVLLFHVTDERDARAWQSGLFYADDTPKSSLAPVRAAAELAREGKLASCGKAKKVNPVQRVVFRSDERQVELVCNQACRYVAKLVPLPGETAGTGTSTAASGEAPADTELAVDVDAGGLAPGRYRYLLRVAARKSPGAAVVRYGPEVTVTEPPPPPPPAEPEAEPQGGDG